MPVDGSVWFNTLIALGVISAISLVGAATLVLSPNVLQRGLLVLISFAAGTLLGNTFFNLIPEISETEQGFDLSASFMVLTGLIAFFILEKILHWHHSHVPHEEVLHPVAVANLVGDALHNFVDGTIVAGTFLVSPRLGLATAISVAIHEIPQELGDFGILVHAGLKPKKVLLLNLAGALVAIAGGALTLAFASVASVGRYVLPFTAGAFIYIAATDLIPELHKEPELRKSFTQLGGLVGGIGVMALLLLLG